MTKSTAVIFIFQIHYDEVYSCDIYFSDTLWRSLQLWYLFFRYTMTKSTAVIFIFQIHYDEVYSCDIY